MGFSKVYKSLQDIFPEIDNRVLRAVALENRKDADAAAEVVLTKVIPHFIARSTLSGSSVNDKTAVPSSEVAELRAGASHGEQDALVENTTYPNEEEHGQSFDAENGDELETENSERCCDHLVATSEALISYLEKEANGPKDATCETESVPSIIKDESTFYMGPKKSTQICCTDVIEEVIALERNMKKALFHKMQSVVNLVTAVEIEERSVEQVKKEAANGELEILKRVEELNEKLHHAKEANTLHSCEVYGEKAILATEVKELQSRILSLSDQKVTSLGILDEIYQNLEGRLVAAKKEKEAVEKNIFEKEVSARKVLAEKQLIMEKVVQEANVLQQLGEENSRLRKFLVDRGRIVDILQEEIYVVNEDARLLKEKLDELLAPGKSLSSSQTSHDSPSSSSSLKIMAPELVDLVIVQADPSGTAEKTNPSPHLVKLSPSDAEATHNETEALGNEDTDEEWEFCDV